MRAADPTITRLEISELAYLFVKQLTQVMSPLNLLNQGGGVNEACIWTDRV
jgi:hypothetical protein